jgi:molecular chaperone DnaK
VTFDIDANGILNVAAQDKGTGRQQSISISNTGGLSSLEVERMRQEAQIYADYDRKQQEIAQYRNQVDGVIYSYTATIKDNGHFVDASMKERAEGLIEELKVLVVQPEVSPQFLQQKIDQLQQVLLELGTAVYHNSSKQPGAAEPSKAVNVGNSRDSSGWSIGDEATIIGDDIDETVITDYEAVD